MATPTLATFLRRMKQTMAADGLANRSDRELIELVRAQQDAIAVRAILERHGPMVYQVCQRVLSTSADVEDAFQATFMVLIRRGHTIRRQDSLASWLHGVARRTALKLRTQANRRRRREERAAKADAINLGDETPWRDVRLVLDEELGRLPETYRAVLVLVYLEGRTQDEAAAQLALSKSTLQRRLNKARELFGRRLARRGIAPGMVLAARLISDCADAAVPHTLLVRTAESASNAITGRAVTANVLSPRVVKLTEGVTKAMLYAKYKSVAAVLVCGLALGIGMQQLSSSVSAQDKTAASSTPSKTTTPDVEPIDPTLVFDPEVQKQLRLSANQVRQLTDAKVKGTEAAADQSKRTTEIDQRIQKLEEEIVKLREQRNVAYNAVEKSQTDQVRAAIPKVMSRDAIQQLRQVTLQRMQLSDVLLDKKMRTRLDLNDEQVKKIQEIAETKSNLNRYVSTLKSVNRTIARNTLVDWTSNERLSNAELAYFLSSTVTEIPLAAELLKVLTPAQRETLEHMSGMSFEKK